MTFIPLASSEILISSNDTVMTVKGDYNNGYQPPYMNLTSNGYSGNVLIRIEYQTSSHADTWNFRTKVVKNGVDFGTETNSSTVSWNTISANFTTQLNTTDIFTLKVRPNDIVTGDSVRNFRVYLNNSLIYPYNSSVLIKTYPPLTTSINFTWMQGGLSSNLLIAKDSSFNLIAVDTTTANNYSIQSLEAGNYWWKVRYYNSTSGTYGNYSDTFNFTLSNTQTTTGTAIQGTVYELVSGVNTPISGATVYISSASANWSSSQTVGSNGYYLFTGLTNGTTYYLSAKALGYNDGTTEYVTTGNGVWTTKNIPLTLCISGLTCYGTVNYVKFVATDFYGNLYSGLSVSVYKGTDITTTYTATTGTDGAATFRLTKDQSYRLEFTGSAITSTTITITPGESTLFYVFVSTSTPTKWWDNTTYQEVDTVRTGVTTATVGGIAYVNVTYNDSLAQTTAWTVYLNQTNHTQPNASQIMIQSATGSGNFSQSFSIASGYAGESYLVNIVATHTTFGTILRSFGVQFYGTKDGSLDFIPSVIMAIIAIAILVFVGGFFDSTNFAQGAGIICVLGWIELGLGMFAYFDIVKIGLALSIASVLAVISNLNERNKKELGG